MKFTKMHGVGNDYVYVNLFQETVSDPSALAKVISHRHRGVGSDGLILIGPSQQADARMQMFNADGSQAQMCGNGIRCVAKYMVEHGITTGPEVLIETDAGLKSCLCQMKKDRVSAVRVDMGTPSLKASDLPASTSQDTLINFPLDLNGECFHITCVSMGNPHAIVFVDHVQAFEAARLGAAISNHTMFLQRINVHFVQTESADHAIVRSWERGSGETKACGTGACAVCVAGVVTQRLSRRVTTSLPGGDLLIEWCSDDHVHMTGPAVEVFSGEWLSF